MSAAMRAAREAADPDDQVPLYKKQLDQLAQMKTAYNEAAMASGQWHVQTVQNISASEQFTEQIRRNKLGVLDFARAWQEYRRTSGGALRESINEQIALRNATATQFGATVFGKNATELHLPKNLGPELDNTRVKLGMINQAIGAASTSMVNWGKNTQWAGRQITVGLTVPLGIAAVGAAAMALKVDEQLTRIAKVYDTVNQDGMAQERELGVVREAGLQTATRLAHEYGAAMEETLNVQAELAATGLSGGRLQEATSEVVRIATLGEMDYQKAIEMTISLQTAFKLSNEELTESFNTMNAVENATSLQIQDIAEAIPRAASAISAMGGSVDDLMVMMTALRESGVDPAIGANAIKSATATLLTPTREALDYFNNALNIDLAQMVENANGNVLGLLTDIGVAFQSLDATQVQAGIGHLFGKYQFDRATALVTNLGDAVTGVQNQTAKTMEVVGYSSADLAASADEEMRRLQASISNRWKRAVEGIKAEIVPLGDAVLGIVIPMLEWVTALIEKFNGLPGPLKNFTLIALAAGAVVGPLMMLIGIFANLFGSVVKFSSSMFALITRFRALNATEAAAAIMARKANSAFDQEGAAVARLTMQIEALNRAMQENNIAQGLAMGNNGQIGNRRVVQGANGLEYASGSRGANGRYLGKNTPVTREDEEAFRAVNIQNRELNETTTKIKRSWGDIGRSVGNVAMVGLPIAFALMTDIGGEANGILDTVMIVAALASTGIFGPVLTMLGRVKTAVTTALAGPAVTGAISKITGGFASLKSGGVAGAFRSIGPGIARAAKAMWNFRTVAFSVFGAAGVLAVGVGYIWNLVAGLRQADAEMKALANSGEAWSNALGYTHMPGVMPGMDEEDIVDSHARIIDIANKMREAEEDLEPALRKAAAAGREYSAAMGQALEVLTNGGSVQNARDAFRASLELADIDEANIDELLIRFDKVNLENPEEIREQLLAQLQNATKGIDPEQISVNNDTDGFWDTIGGWFRKIGGGELSTEARDAGYRIGTALGNVLQNATTQLEKEQGFAAAAGQVDKMLSAEFEALADSPELKSALREMEIRTADEFITAMNDLENRVRNEGERLEGPEAALWEAIAGKGGAMAIDPEFTRIREMHTELMGTIIDNMVEAGEISEDEAEKIKAAFASISTLADDFDASPKPILDLAAATDKWQHYIRQAETSGRDLSEEEKLLYLNSVRAQAGLDAASSSAQGMGSSAQLAAQGAQYAARGLNEMAEAAKAIEITPEMRLEQLRSTFTGTMDDIYGEAARVADEHFQARADAADDAFDAEEARLERAGRAQDKYWDNRIDKLEGAQEKESQVFEDGWDRREQALRDSQDRQDRTFERSWDRRERAMEAYYERQTNRIESQIDAAQRGADARIDAINKQIEAEQDADEARQRIFEREKTRLQRMSQMFSNNMDFNAALDTGNLDEAARVFQSTQTVQQEWAIDDAADASERAAKRREETLRGRIENIERERDARVDALEKQQDALERERERRLRVLNQMRQDAQTALNREQEHRSRLLKAQREAETRAMRARQEEARKTMESQRDNAKRALDAQREANRLSRDSAVKSAQAAADADKRSLESRLRELKAFVPRNEREMRNHTRRIEALYREYGIDLKRQGNQWSTFIGDKLQENIRIAANALKNDINWQAIGKVISDRMSGQLGVTAKDLAFFIKNGKFPKEAKIRTIADLDPTGLRHRHMGGMVYHSGGVIRKGGHGPAVTQRDRMGIPRSASPYPSEVPVLAKRGEFIVNDKATRHNLPLLEHLNSGGTFHRGGLFDATVGIGSVYGTALGLAYDRRIREVAGERYNAEKARLDALSAAQATFGMGPGMAPGSLGGGAGGSGRFSTNTSGWPPRVWYRESPNTTGAVNFVRRRWGLNNIGTVGDRPNTSDHPWGKALDVMIPNYQSAQGIALGTEIANWFVNNPNAFGTKYVIWRDRITSGSGWGWYGHPNAPSGNGGDTLQHRDHPHISLYHGGGLIPQLKSGGFTLTDGLANLHAGEGVLTKPLTESFKENVANGGGTGYTVNINFTGPVSADIDVERGVTRALDKIESRRGRRRRIG